MEAEPAAGPQASESESPSAVRVHSVQLEQNLVELHPHVPGHDAYAGFATPQLQQTVYFQVRRQFHLTQQELGSLQSGEKKLVARALIDDGAVVLVNGVELARVNIPGPIEKPV